MFENLGGGNGGIGIIQIITPYILPLYTSLQLVMYLGSSSHQDKTDPLLSTQGKTRQPIRLKGNNHVAKLATGSLVVIHKNPSFF